MCNQDSGIIPLDQRVEGCQRHSRYQVCGIGIEYAYMASCMANEVDGLYSRHSLDIPVVVGYEADCSRRKFTNRMMSFMNWFKCQGVFALEPKDYIERYSGQMRKRYEDAYDLYLARGYWPGDAHVKSFVKAERVVAYSDYRAIHKKVKPRLIHPRKPLYNLLLGCFLKPLESSLKKYRLLGPRNTLKGLDLKQRASVVLKHVEFVGDCEVYEVDCSSFDGHVNGFTLGAEHSIYNKIFKDPFLKQLLKQQLRSSCTSNCGYSYTLHSRCSGDVNTSLGNHLINMGMIESYMLGKYGKTRKWSYVVDGDDALLFVKKGVAINYVEFVSHFRAMGQEVKLEGPYAPADLTFCRSKIYYGPNGPTFVRDPRRILGGLLTVYRHLENLPSYYFQIALGETHVSNGVPLVQEFVHTVLDRLHLLGKVNKEARFPPSSFDYYARAFPKSICAPTRYTKEQLVEYLRLWNISMSDYRNILTLVSRMDFGFQFYDW